MSDQALILWAKAVVAYCKKACVKSMAIQTLVKDVNIGCKYICDNVHLCV